jgi:uncharacterized protein
MRQIKGRRCLLAIGVAIVVALSLSKTLLHWLTEVWWFDAVGAAEVFWTRLGWQVAIGSITFGLYALVLGINYRVATGGMNNSAELPLRDRRLRRLRAEEGALPPVVHGIAAIAIGAIALIAAVTSASDWETMLKFLNATPFNQTDPIFQRDLGFYLFQLPGYESIWNWLMMLCIVSVAIATLVYIEEGAILAVQSAEIQFLAPRAKTHLSILFSAIAVLVGIDFWLKRYRLLYGSHRVNFGAGYTDTHAQVFAYTVMSVMAVGVAILLLISIRRRGFGLVVQGLGLFAIVALLVTGIYPTFQQKLIVEPNELAKEKPYIAHSIKFTQQAYHLHDVQRQSYSATAKLDRQALQDNAATIRNIRLWDYRPLLSTYRQLQEIRLYYHFDSVDMDRYQLNGDYQQVMLSARELVADKLPAEAQTWVNRHLKFTHGYGLAMSPVNRSTSDGLPELYVKDIPPVTTVDLKIDRPGIYYGESTHNYIFTGTQADEFDYPLGDKNAVTRYQGQGGVPMPTLGHRLAYALDLGSLELLFSNYFTDRSRIHYYRTIQERVHHIAPFLELDSDPYLVVANGKLQWIQDAYTVSNRYPYAEPLANNKAAKILFKDQNTRSFLDRRINYIRNSVKVSIDAYDGTASLWAIDETDPVLRTYRKIFPHLFTSPERIPPEIKEHFRYPVDLFKIQSLMYLTYHMSDPEVFYNREDLWQFPIQTYESSEQIMLPYYTILYLPGEKQAEFVQIMSFTPSNKDNTIAWMAARSNTPNYNKLLLYEFPKKQLIFGPRQIEAKIDQDPQISQQFTLWSQAGSKVIRGDLLVLPIRNALLYVEPVYLRAEQGALPQLKRVIVAYDKSIVMAETLDLALAAVFDGTSPSPPPAPTTSKVAIPAQSSLVKSAIDKYQKAEAAARQGNWAEYGRYQQELKQILQRLEREN